MALTQSRPPLRLPLQLANKARNSYKPSGSMNAPADPEPALGRQMVAYLPDGSPKAQPSVGKNDVRQNHAFCALWNTKKNTITLNAPNA